MGQDTLELKLRQMQLGRFWKKYLRLTRAGVPVLTTLEIVAGEERDEDFGTVIRDIQDAMAEGIPLSEAMERNSGYFSLSARTLIRTAEKTGNWDLVLEELADGLLEGTFD